MSHLSYMEKLLDGVEVEWNALEDVAFFANGKGHEKVITENGNYIVVNSKFISTDGKVAKYSDEQLCPLSVDDILIVMSDLPNGKALAKTFIVDKDNKYTLNQRIGAISVKNKKLLLPKFLNYFLNRTPSLTKYDNGVDQTNLKKGQILDVKIPIPCPNNPKKSLEIQAEIVRILDAFTAMTAELAAELSMRRKQYNYYRNQLLNFEEGDFEWVTLGDVTKKWYSGSTPTAGKLEFYEGGNIPWLRTQEVKFSDISETAVFITSSALKNSSAKWIPENCVIIAISGATAGRSAINKIPLTTNQHCGCLEIDSKKALYRYVFHWVSFNYENIKALGQGARGDLNSTIIKNFRLPVPYANDPEKSLVEQARIVAILDKFDTLTTSLQEGLPREIELRQKQYEYYRDLLLSFPKQNAEVSA
ncbi:restriction endonuclease subunit S [Marinomonas primoryensis]|uniref:Restriction endonuclease subunit S n=1 Tax=Marinomonas primoryensis TaxID=178399 RepID=A0A2Z4PPS9_9GAMM|nr:restriction endonuclease subunit S [Marinomonas primoryensis]AWX99446.1 restriction endonuclease subunit S [Marinomonas primoryensis]